MSQKVGHPILTTKAWFELKTGFVGFVVEKISLGMAFPVSLGCYFLIIMPQKIYNPYPTAFPYGNGMVLHFYQQQESSTTKTVHKVINKGLKTYV